MFPITRRSLIGAAATILAPRSALATPSADARLRQILDSASDAPQAAIAALQAIDPHSLSGSSRLDRDTAIAGLTIDMQIGSRFGAAPFGGDTAHYALLLRRITADDADPNVLRRRLARELKVTLTRTERLFARIDRRRGTTGERFAALWREPRWLYSDDDKGRDQAAADMNRVLEAARLRIGAAFPPLPPEVFDVGVQWTLKNGYRDVPAPGVPGGYFVDLADIRRRPRWTLPAVVHHELLPGHMVQLPVEARADPHPLRLTYASAFAEGWAIYAEQLAAAQGAYAGDPMADLGHCHWLLFRITRGLVDIGMHLDGWSVDEALNRLQAWMGEPVYFAPFEGDVDRVRRQPASRAAEAFVWLELSDLARGRDLPGYHRTVLDGGRKRTDLLRDMLAPAR
ncbi:DUF885 family protein [Sphingomonas sp. RS6]